MWKPRDVSRFTDVMVTYWYNIPDWWFDAIRMWLRGPLRGGREENLLAPVLAQIQLPPQLTTAKSWRSKPCWSVQSWPPVWFQWFPGAMVVVAMLVVALLAIRIVLDMVAVGMALTPIRTLSDGFWVSWPWSFYCRGRGVQSLMLTLGPAIMATGWSRLENQAMTAMRLGCCRPQRCAMAIASIARWLQPTTLALHLQSCRTSCKTFEPNPHPFLLQCLYSPRSRVAASSPKVLGKPAADLFHQFHPAMFKIGNQVFRSDCFPLTGECPLSNSKMMLICFDHGTWWNMWIPSEEVSTRFAFLPLTFLPLKEICGWQGHCS